MIYAYSCDVEFYGFFLKMYSYSMT